MFIFDFEGELIRVRMVDAYMCDLFPYLAIGEVGLKEQSHCPLFIPHALSRYVPGDEESLGCLRLLMLFSMCMRGISFFHGHYQLAVVLLFLLFVECGKSARCAYILGLT